jgi:hypothetical protein
MIEFMTSNISNKIVSVGRKRKHETGQVHGVRDPKRAKKEHQGIQLTEYWCFGYAVSIILTGIKIDINRLQRMHIETVSSKDTTYMPKAFLKEQRLQEVREDNIKADDIFRHMSNFLKRYIIDKLILILNGIKEDHCYVIKIKDCDFCDVSSYENGQVVAHENLKMGEFTDWFRTLKGESAELVTYLPMKA